MFKEFFKQCICVPRAAMNITARARDGSNILVLTTRLPPLPTPLQLSKMGGGEPKTVSGEKSSGLFVDYWGSS